MLRFGFALVLVENFCFRFSSSVSCRSILGFPPLLLSLLLLRKLNADFARGRADVLMMGSEKMNLLVSEEAAIGLVEESRKGYQVCSVQSCEESRTIEAVMLSRVR